MKTPALITAALLTLAACGGSAPDPITQAVSGRTLVQGDTRISPQANGDLVGTLANGDALAGTWRVKDGKWCRTLNAPERFSGPEVCQDVALGEGEIVITGSNGEPQTYTIE